MKNATLIFLALIMVMTASTAFAFRSIGDAVDANCAPEAPFNGDCNLCHANSANFDQALAGNYDYFCPTTAPTCIDADQDGYFSEGGDCGPADCNDSDSAINPGAQEICGDGIDQDCSGADLSCPPTGPTCTDVDQDGFYAEGGDCGPTDCNDEVAAINPAAAERCTDNIDNNCDGLTDGQDTATCPAPPSCNDLDADGFFAEADCNTVQDCNDSDNLTYPGATELCGDQIDNDCDGSVDEGCDSVNDGAALYQDFCATCHGELADSNVCGEDAREIMEAIMEDEGGMGALSSLTDDQVKMIAESLSNCKNDDDEDGGDSKGHYDKEHHDKGHHDRGHGPKNKHETKSHSDD